MAFVAPARVGSSWTRGHTCVSCMGRKILTHCTTGEVPQTCTCIYFYSWPCCVSVALRRLSLAVMSRGYSSLRCMGSHRSGFSCRRAQAFGRMGSLMGSVVAAQSSRKRLRRCRAWAKLLRGMWNLLGPWIGPLSSALAGRFPTHCTIREVHHFIHFSRNIY